MSKYEGSINIGDLLEFLNITHADHRRLVEFLITNKKESNEFIFSFYTGNPLKDIHEYQMFKRDLNMVDIDTYYNRFLDNRVAATEQLFQEPLCLKKLALMDKYNVSSRELYRRLERVPHGSYLNLVRTSLYELSLKPYNDDFLIRY